MGKFAMGTIFFVAIVLYFGGFIAGFVVDYLPFMEDVWIKGIAIGMIQVAVLALVGLTSGKLGLWMLLIGSIVILVTGMIGGYVAGWLGFTGLFATFVIVIIQSIGLIAMGTVKGKATPSIKV